MRNGMALPIRISGPVKMSDISAVVHRSTRQHGVSDAFFTEAGIGHWSLVNDML